MAWWGKVIGGTFGFFLGGPIGALFGATMGHQFDQGPTANMGRQRTQVGGQERTQAAFFGAVFSIMGHIAKADGKVTPDEINMAKTVMDRMSLSADQRQAAIALFNQGKRNDFPLDDVLAQFRREAGRRRDLIRIFIEVLYGAALADGKLHPAEKQIISRAANAFGLSSYELESIEAMLRAGATTQQEGKPSLKSAYDTLGVSAASADDEIKKAYRRLLSQHHPDKLVSKGLPEEMIALANQRTHEIRLAYDVIRLASKA